MPKSRAQVREEFAKNGWSISGWAKQRRYSPNMVIAILADDETNPRIKCLRGEAHNIAVELKLKDGVLSPQSGRSLAAA
ncbi:DNA-binding protein [Acidovorax sp. DW039]|uniref:DNA-binding protein n=1 Tax=Acidovorax sp. DW039 TaxID=3095606 RepID=UPI003088916B|nr:DNA-binding protein [Acidovorax sp. DW039]